MRESTTYRFREPPPPLPLHPERILPECEGCGLSLGTEVCRACGARLCVLCAHQVDGEDLCEVCAAEAFYNLVRDHTTRAEDKRRLPRLT